MVATNGSIFVPYATKTAVFVAVADVSGVSVRVRVSVFVGVCVI